MLVLALLSVIALVASSCGTGQAWIARVDNQPIDSPNFWAGVSLYSGLAGGGLPGVETEPDRGVVEMPEAATYAMFLLQLHGLTELNAENGTEVTEADLNQVRQTLLASTQAASFEDLPGWFLDQIVTAQAHYEALIAHFAGDTDIEALVAAYYEENKDQFQQVCLDVINGLEEAELADARKRLEEGAEFATVAEAVAASQPADASGTVAPALGDNADGDVGCIPVSTLVNMFADPAEVSRLTDAEPGSLVGPVPVAGGIFMLFRVRSTEVQPLAEARATIEQSLGQPGQQEAQAALNEFLTEADIELNPRIGSWERGVGYLPPGAELPPGQTTIPVIVSEASG